jgi:hypothetical protein
MTEKRKLEIEETLKNMNDLISKMLQKTVHSHDFQKKIMFFLRSIASIRERMLETENPALDDGIREEVSRLESEALSMIQ